jgi:hypothetical protein
MCWAGGSDKDVTVNRRARRTTAGCRAGAAGQPTATHLAPPTSSTWLIVSGRWPTSAARITAAKIAILCSIPS